MGLLRTLVAVLVIFAGISNGVAGILALLPGMFEAEMARLGADPEPGIDPEAGVVPSGTEGARAKGEEGAPSLLELARTRYGATALLFLGAALLQVLAGSQLTWLLAWPASLVPWAAVVLGVAAELWGWQLKSELSVFNVFGLAASGLLALVVTVPSLRSG